ncbi:LPXTG cell wall anchor domain-containing protein [uncultured Clostridium sp.]|uniref:LPXTG cell wall anchor domain-containing protein n=1 Tax=uncultured Clostridium sp. TaxID=59620 RepID=UPI002673AA34|nr:LPXTG cell wall anchor domain-containing protein [uncultured Clostridium sp.]
MNKNKKINKEKTLALVLAGGLVTSTLNVVNTSADMIQDVNLVESVSTSNESVIPNQTLNFDKSKPSDITITGVKFNSKDLKSISITNEKGEPINFKLNEINVDKDSATITIPSNVVSNLNLTVGVHAISLHFSDDSATIGAVSVNVIDSNSAVNPPKDDNTIVVPPVTPPSDDKNDKEDTITKKPTIEYQKLTFDMNNKQDLVVSNVNFDNTKLEYIYINGKEISAKELKIENDKIIIPSNVISNVISVKGNYTISFKFSEGSSLINAVDIEVKDKNVIAPPVTPPSDDTVTPPSIDKENTIVIDKNNLKSIEIPNFIPSGSNVKFVTINGKKLPVKYMNIRTASNEEITPAVYVYGDKLVIPVEVLKYVGIDVDKYDIEATLEDGTTVSKSIQLQVINSSNKEDDKVTEKPSDNNQITNKPSNKPSNNEIANGNANKNDSIKLENSSNNKLPNTGAAVSSGLIGSLSTLIGAVLLRKKK